jgi:hypothetical protein
VDLHAVDAALRDKLIAELHLPPDQDPLFLSEAPWGDRWVSPKLSEYQRRVAMARAVEAYGADDQVEAVFTRDFLATQPKPTGFPDGLTVAERATASFDPERSGDFVVVLREGIMGMDAPTKATDYASIHGSPWNYDRRVPILFWRRGLPSFEQPNAVETIDIMPTLASLIGLELAPGEVDGRCLDLSRGADDSCARTHAAP